MVIQLLQPQMLWGLLGLAVPIAIHLLHKRSSRVLMVGSLKTFTGGAPVQARSLRPNELWLLLLRCLLFSLLVMLLCEPMMYQEEEEQKRYLFIAPELAALSNADSIAALGYEPRLLQPGLPLLQKNVVPDTSPFSYWDVFREIEGLDNAGDSVWIRFYPFLNRFSGDRPALSKIFVPLPEAPKQLHLAQAIQLTDSRLLLQYWQEEQGLWRLVTETHAAADLSQLQQKYGITISPEAPDTLRIMLQHPADAQQEARMWQTALQLIDSLQPARVLQLETLPDLTQLPENFPQVWVWLARKEPPEAFLEAENISRFRLSEEEGVDWFSGNGGIHKPVMVHSTLQAQQHNRVQLARFLPQLMEMLPLADSPASPPVLLSQEQWQPEQRQPGQHAFIASAGKEEGVPLENYLWIALVLVLIVERWLSLRK
ncbi:hypothetical protein D770_00270 [Flammeovirgaceae bacterium 311]|nr:hypothetical protein D770_00270 [Flammeovirgaceae bacterium 311]